MSQPNQFEGPDVRVLLDEICSKYGTEPTISRAETFRTGGVLGFFQREHYRLVVDEPMGADPTFETSLATFETSLATLTDAPVIAPLPLLQFWKGFSKNWVTGMISRRMSQIRTTT